MKALGALPAAEIDLQDSYCFTVTSITDENLFRFLCLLFVGNEQSSQIFCKMTAFRLVLEVVAELFQSLLEGLFSGTIPIVVKFRGDTPVA